MKTQTPVLKYKDRLQLSQQEKEGQEVEFQEEEAKQQLQSDILATKKSLANKQKALNVAKNTFPLNAQNVIEIQVEIEGLEDGLKKLAALEAELF